MAKRLKCWKPTRAHKIGTKILEMKNESEDSILWISPEAPKYVNFAEFDKGLWHRGFTKELQSPSQTITFAKKYMEEHDTC